MGLRPKGGSALEQRPRDDLRKIRQFRGSFPSDEALSEGFDPALRPF
jgi:hypothetical protein